MVVVWVLAEYRSVVWAVVFAIVTVLLSVVEYLALLEDFLGLSGHPFAIFFVFIGELTVGKFL